MSRLLQSVLSGLLLPLCFTLTSRATGDTSAQTEEDEKLLRALKVGVDGPGLLEFFRQQTPTAADRTRLDKLAADLADPSFRTREKAAADLMAAGLKALPALRASLQNGDLEARRRAQRCIEKIEKNAGREALLAAARLIQLRRPSGASAVLLDYLPSAPDEAVDQAVLAALWFLTARDGKTGPESAAALTDKMQARRGAAALLVGRFGEEPQKAKVRNLLTADPSRFVRLRAAHGLLADRDRTAIPALLQLLEQGPLELAQQAEELLARVAGKQAPEVPLGEEADARRQRYAAWAGWWQAHKDQVDLKRAELDTPLASTSWLARVAALRFLTALSEGNLDAAVQVVGLPFSLDGVATFKTEKDFLDMLRPAVEAQAKKKLKFTVLRMVRPAEYARLVSNAQLQVFLKNLPTSESHVLYARSNEAGPGVENTGALIVRVQGGVARVVGIGQLSAAQAGK